MWRFPISLFLWTTLTLLAACADPKCPPNYLQIGMTCKKCPDGSIAAEWRCFAGDAEVPIQETKADSGTQHSVENDEQPAVIGEAGVILDRAGDGSAERVNDSGGVALSAADAATAADTATAADASRVCGTCTGSRPVCDPGSATCVACNQDSDCPSASRAKCSLASHECVPCDAKAQCAHVADGLGVCSAGACVQCNTSDQTACAGTAKPFCGGAVGTSCVACNANLDCLDPTRPTCEANVCRPCRGDIDCTSKIDDATALDACYQGQCVDCRVDPVATKVDIGCTRNVACNPATHECTGEAKNSVKACQACVADSECEANYRCIAMTYRAASHGGYCLKTLGDACEVPFRTAITRKSLSGAPAEIYCGVNESLTTCEVVVAFGTGCNTQECIKATASGAVCNVGTASCTYPCATTMDCHAMYPCPIMGMPRYCGQL